MRFAFHKMHGLGNDFVIVDARAAALPAIDAARARAIADRRRGIGCDQLIVIEPAPNADLRMRIFNADGGEAGQCGNALRCVAALTGARTIATAGGRAAAAVDESGIHIDMGAPRFDWDAIPLADPLDTARLPIGWEALEGPAAVNVGNPHLVFFVADAAAVDLARLGPIIEHDPLFPQGVNVNVAEVTGPAALTLRVWERGAGLTRACGTGACATAVAALRRGLVQGPVTVTLPGGPLVIDWAPGGGITMTGPATHVFAGEADWDTFG
jgi:diaminopimelate epimerase